MENLEKMATVIADVFYKVFDLIWSLEIPSTSIRVIIIPLVTLIVNFVVGAILGIHISRPRPNFRKNAQKSVAKWGVREKHRATVKNNASVQTVKNFTAKARERQAFINKHKHTPN